MGYFLHIKHGHGSAISKSHSYFLRVSIALNEDLMHRYLIAAFFCLGWLTQSGRSEPFQPIVGLPHSYNPGEPVMFDVRLPAISNLGAYNIDLVLESSAGNAGTDFFFDAAATTPALTSYIFPSTANFLDAATVDSSMRHRITLTDFAFSGVNVSGANDHVVTVTFRTTPEFKGRLRLFVDTPLLILDRPSAVPTPVQGFDVIKNDITAAGSVELVPVPEPSNFLIASSALLSILIANCKTRRQALRAMPSSTKGSHHDDETFCDRLDSHRIYAYCGRHRILPNFLDRRHGELV